MARIKSSISSNGLSFCFQSHQISKNIWGQCPCRRQVQLIRQHGRVVVVELFAVMGNHVEHKILTVFRVNFYEEYSFFVFHFLIENFLKYLYHRQFIGTMQLEMWAIEETFNFVLVFILWMQKYSHRWCYLTGHL